MSLGTSVDMRHSLLLYIDFLLRFQHPARQADYGWSLARRPLLLELWPYVPQSANGPDADHAFCGLRESRPAHNHLNGCVRVRDRSVER